MPSQNVSPNRSDDNAKVPDASASPTTPNSADPFSPENLEKLRLSQDFSTMANVKPVLTTIAVRKPQKQEFIRVRPGENWQFRTASFTEKESGESYLVSPTLLPHLIGDVQETLFLVAISRNSPIPFLWPCTLPGAEGRSNRWWDSALAAARQAEARWVRVVADMAAGCYVPYVAQGNLSEPQWPEGTLDELFRMAFKDRYIQTLDHPVLKRLRGEV